MEVSCSSETDTNAYGSAAVRACINNTAGLKTSGPWSDQELSTRCGKFLVGLTKICLYLPSLRWASGASRASTATTGSANTAVVVCAALISTPWAALISHPSSFVPVGRKTQVAIQPLLRLYISNRGTSCSLRPSLSKSVTQASHDSGQVVLILPVRFCPVRTTHRQPGL